MINKITFTNFSGESLEIPLANPEESGLVVKKISGLGSAEANVNISSVATSDIGLFNSARLKKRNLVFTFYVVSTPTETVEEVRIKTYKFMPIKHKVKVTFETDTRNAYIEGYVEENQANIFDKMETISLTIVCPNPYFYGVNNEITMFSGVHDVFEFPFDNNSVSQNKIEMGEIVNRSLETVFYSGEIDTGVIITVHCLGKVSNLTIYNYYTKEHMFIDTNKIKNLTGTGLTTGDDIIINTNEQKKSIYLLREGTYTNLLNCLDKNTDWFKLHVGANVFAYIAEEGATMITFSIETYVLYEGI